MVVRSLNCGFWDQWTFMYFSGAIGVFDSGVGGLSVLHHIRHVLPNERLIYVADSGHVPYGDKPAAYIEQRSNVLARFLIEQGADAIVIACNTATVAAAASLRSQFNVPIVAMEPAVKPAVAATSAVVMTAALAALPMLLLRLQASGQLSPLVHAEGPLPSRAAAVQLADPCCRCRCRRLQHHRCWWKRRRLPAALQALVGF